MRLNSFIERTRSAPWGIDGGQEALPNRVSVVRGSGEVVSFGNGKVDGHQVAPGDRVVVETGGGSGWGDPRQRRREAVLSDVASGYVSPEAAREHYGVDVHEQT